jgi:hypothetical protein
MNEPAFPTERIGVESGEVLTYQEEGMTLRDYFAAKAMQAFESRQDLDDIPAFNKANRCYRIADAMLKARTE